MCIFSDSLRVMKVVTQLKKDFGPNGALTTEIHEVLRGSDILSINLMEMMANEATHQLA